MDDFREAVKTARRRVGQQQLGFGGEAASVAVPLPIVALEALEGFSLAREASLL